MTIRELLQAIPELENEVVTRQESALAFFNKNPQYKPHDYTVTHRSSGFRPVIKGRAGCQIGYTNDRRSGFNVYTCYLVRKGTA